MANRRVGLYKYVPLPQGWRYCKAIFHDNNRIKPHSVRTPNGEQTIKAGQYYLSYSRKWEPVGDDPAEAFRRLQKKRGELQVIANGGAVVQEQQTPGVTLRAALNDWLEEVADSGAHNDTYSAKRLVSDEFVKACKGVRLLSEVTRKHCLQYINAWLKKRGNDDRTRFNKFLHLRQFLNRNNLDHLTKKDAPKYSLKDPVAFEDGELSLFWKVCAAHKQLLYTILLCCGLRLQEIMTLRWEDIIWNEGVLRIQSRPEWDYKPKKHHCRDIPLSDDLLQRLRQRKENSKSTLVFHTKSGKPLTHLWDDMQAICKKANIPMDKAHPHTFRATFCTTLLRQNLPLPDVMRVMGHKDPESTLRYMAVLRKTELRERMTKVQFAVA